MKKVITIVLACVMVLSMMLVGCGGNGGGGGDAAPPPAAPEASAPAEQTATPPPSGNNPIINLWSFTDEIPRMVERYKVLHPDFAYDFNTTIIATTEGAYQPALDQALSGGGGSAPDIYAVEAAFVMKYTQGDASDYAMTYKDLGIDIDAKLAEAQIATYASDIGTRISDGQIVALPYQATGGGFIYRRSIAKDTWGTDDPKEIAATIGPGWEKFLSAAEDLAAKGYAIVSGDGDVWHPLENASPTGWVVDGKLNIDPSREYLLDLSKEMKDKGYMNDTVDWQDPWFADMRDEGPKPVFGYYGPAWLINYVMAGNAGSTVGDWGLCESNEPFSWGGTWICANKNLNPDVQDAVRTIIEWITLDTSDEGLQYYWANGTLFDEPGAKDTVSSGVVMAKSDGSLDFLAGQNMYDVYIPAGATATGKNKHQYDETINIYWRDQVRMYTAGEKSRDAAIADFKRMVADNLDIVVD